MKLSPAMQKLMALPVSPRWKKMDAICDRLRARFGAGEFKLSDLMKEIKAEGLPPFKTIKDMHGRLKFVGDHRGDQRYKLS